MKETFEIIDSIILLQILLLGVFSTGGLIFALLLLFGKFQWARGKLGALYKVPDKVLAQALIAGGLLTLFPVYFLGVTTHYWADRWIDKPSYWHHLGLKSWWPEDDRDKTDDGIKCAMYIRAFDCVKNLCKDESNVKKVREWYFQVYSHLILDEGNKEFREYILSAQRRVNLARLWAFVSFVIFVVCLIRLFCLFLHYLYRNLRPQPSVNGRKNDLYTVLIVAVVAVMIYVVSGPVWVGAERGTSARVWRFAKSFPEKAKAWELSGKDDRGKCSPLNISTAHPEAQARRSD